MFVPIVVENVPANPKAAARSLIALSICDSTAAVNILLAVGVVNKAIRLPL